MREFELQPAAMRALLVAITLPDSVLAHTPAKTIACALSQNRAHTHAQLSELLQARALLKAGRGYKLARAIERWRTDRLNSDILSDFSRGVSIYTQTLGHLTHCDHSVFDLAKKFHVMTQTLKAHMGALGALGYILSDDFFWTGFFNDYRDLRAKCQGLVGHISSIVINRLFVSTDWGAYVSCPALKNAGVLVETDDLVLSVLSKESPRSAGLAAAKAVGVPTRSLKKNAVRRKNAVDPNAALMISAYVDFAQKQRPDWRPSKLAEQDLIAATKHMTALQFGPAHYARFISHASEFFSTLPAGMTLVPTRVLASENAANRYCMAIGMPASDTRRSVVDAKRVLEKYGITDYVAVGLSLKVAEAFHAGTLSESVTWNHVMQSTIVSLVMYFDEIALMRDVDRLLNRLPLTFYKDSGNPCSFEKEQPWHTPDCR